VSAEVIRNAKGEPFSKWKPADRFAYVFREEGTGFWIVCKPEFRFDADRKWRFDFAWPGEKLAVEIDGFGYGHQAVNRISDNNEKRNAAVEQGWRVLVYDSKYLGSRQRVSEAVELACRVLCGIVPEA